MRISHLAGAVVATALASTAVSVTPAQAAVAPGPALLIPAVMAVHSGRPTWVKAYWSTGRDICDAKVTVEAGDTEIFYPTNTETYTSFRHDDDLVAGETDYVAFRVTTTVTRTTLRSMHLTIAFKDGTKSMCDGPVKTRTFYATLPLRRR